MSDAPTLEELAAKHPGVMDHEQLPMLKVVVRLPALSGGHSNRRRTIWARRARPDPDHADRAIVTTQEWADVTIATVDLFEVLDERNLVRLLMRGHQ